MIDDKELEEIFGIPQDGSNITDESQDSTYVNVCGSKGNDSFDDEIGKLLKDSENKNVKKDEIQKIQTPICGEEEDTSSDVKHSNMRTELSEDDSSESVELLGDKILQQVSTKKFDVKSESGSSSVVFSKTKKEFWKIDNSDPLFNRFYEYKKDSLRDWLLVGGHIDFDKINTQLIESRVDLSSINFADFSTLFDTLKQIQSYKDRITQIEITCNNQYFCWKRAIDLFQGLLAQCHYEKPAAKQDGVVFEHMVDFVNYFTRLESLHYNIQSVIKNLDQAFDTVSRQITISLPSRDFESVENRANKNVQNSQQNEFNKSSSNRNYSKDPVDTIKTGTVEWNVLNN